MHNSIFYCVANMPGAVPNTSTYALTNATMPYAVALADKGWQQACRDDHSLALGLNTHAGQLTNAPVGEAVGIDAVSLDSSCADVRVDPTSRTLTRAVRTYLDHLSVERGLAANTLTSYRRDLRRYLDTSRERASTTSDAVTEATVAGVPGAAARGRRRPPAAELHLGGPHRGGGPRVPQVRGQRRAGRRSTRPAAVKPPTPAKRLPKALPLADVEAILEAAGAAGTTLALRDRALLEVLYGTGARISEAVGLDVDDLDLASTAPSCCAARAARSGWCRSGRTRRRPSTAYLVRGRPELATAATGTGNGGALFLNARGGRLSRQSAWAVLVKAAERAGVTRDVSPHTLRHSFATHLLDGGADVRVVQELLGHASVTTTQVYTLVTVDNLREVFAAAHPRARSGG